MTNRARIAIEIDRTTLDGLVMMAAELRAEGFKRATPARLAANMVASVVADDQAAHADDDPTRH